MLGHERITGGPTAQLRSMFENNIQETLHLLTGALACKCIFVIVTVPASLRVQAGTFNTDLTALRGLPPNECDAKPFAVLHYLFLWAFVSIELVQLFFFLCCAVDLRSWYRRPAGSEDIALEAITSALGKRRWRACLCRVNLARYIIPMMGIILSWSSESSAVEPANGMPCDVRDQPKDLWVWLLFCSIARLVALLSYALLLVYNSDSGFLSGSSSVSKGALRKVLESFQYSEAGASITCESQCCICISNFENKETLARLPCSRQHIFHEACVLKWLQKYPECPLCRKKVI
mmetsp:Transcript_10376/g.18306  ORF Transcript_10376/g.18306 Transcript_10376/m.18306 type:complete len:291 (-) Transcript_10376:1618-2490(-)